MSPEREREREGERGRDREREGGRERGREREGEKEKKHVPPKISAPQKPSPAACEVGFEHSLTACDVYVRGEVPTRRRPDATPRAARSDGKL